MGYILVAEQNIETIPIYKTWTFSLVVSVANNSCLNSCIRLCPDSHLDWFNRISADHAVIRVWIGLKQHVKLLNLIVNLSAHLISD